MERLGKKVESQGGNAKVTYRTDGRKFFIHYIVEFHATKFSDGTSLGSTCRITFEIDNKTFVTPDVERVEIPTEQYDNLFKNLPTVDAQQVLFITIVGVVGIGLIYATSGLVAEAILYALGYLLTT